MRDEDWLDLALLAALRDGQTQAFWRLWLRHRRQLFAVCLREMSGNRVDAEDALHEAMLHGYEALPRHAAAVTAPRSWLARMTSNVCRDIHRRHARSTRTAAGLGILTSHCAERAEQPDREYDPKALAALLPERLRDVFVLRVLQRVPYPDIAARLGVTCVTARKRVQQSRAALRAWRESQG